jgi:hypothetical protein
MCIPTTVPVLKFKIDKLLEGSVVVKVYRNLVGISGGRTY